MTMITKVFERYWMIMLVGVYFILISVYNEFGVPRDVFWNTFIKTVRQGFIFTILIMHINRLPNSLSILTCLGAMSYSLGLTVFRYWAAYHSWNLEEPYEAYFELMKRGDIRNYCTLGLFVIMTAVYFVSYPMSLNPINKLLKRITKWKNGFLST